MNQEVKPEEVPAQNPKQFLVMVDEFSMAFLSKLIPSLRFCQVEGLTIPDNANYQILANPLPKPLSE